MIQALRRKFVAINMALVSLVLAVVFGALLYTTARSASRQTTNALLRAVEQSGPADLPMPEIVPRGDEPSRSPKEINRTTVFWVLTDEAGGILQSETSLVEISDETLANVTAAALADGQEEGTLRDPDLRYLVRHTPEGLRIAFADRSDEQATLRSLALRLLATGAAALGAFFLISLYLARWALRPVERAWQQQRQFVADASHELKTPLTVILANTGIMARHPDATVASQSQWLDGIREEGARMKTLIDDMLFLARADALRAPALTGTVNWSETVESAALAFESVAFERGVALQAEIAPGLTVLGDPQQLAQLAGILLDNACKYAGGAKQVTLTLAAGAGVAQLKVQNTGDTLPPEVLGHLFERFYRADTARQRSGGCGLGLAIAQSIVQTHQGQITAASEAGVTTLTVTLPLAKGVGAPPR